MSGCTVNIHTPDQDESLDPRVRMSEHKGGPMLIFDRGTTNACIFFRDAGDIDQWLCAVQDAVHAWHGSRPSQQVPLSPTRDSDGDDGAEGHRDGMEAMEECCSWHAGGGSVELACDQ